MQHSFLAWIIHIIIIFCYFFSEVINFVSIIKHGNNSMAEGLPARIRVITPSYTKYVENKNNFVSNYTVKAVSADKVKKVFSKTHYTLTKFCSFMNCANYVFSKNIYNIFLGCLRWWRHSFRHWLWIHGWHLISWHH